MSAKKKPLAKKPLSAKKQTEMIGDTVDAIVGQVAGAVESGGVSNKVIQQDVDSFIPPLPTPQEETEQIKMISTAVKNESIGVLHLLIDAIEFFDKRFLTPTQAEVIRLRLVRAKQLKAMLESLDS
jgi:hypothetical protein